MHTCAETVERRWRSYPVPRHLEGLVVSSGGVATTMIITHLRQYLTVNAADDSDGLKHRPHPPHMTENPIPALLIVGDFASIWSSLVRRDFHRPQEQRLGCVRCLVTHGDTEQRQMARAVARQRRRWERGWPNLLVVEYDDLWDRVDDIASHFGITDPRFNRVLHDGDQAAHHKA